MTKLQPYSPTRSWFVKIEGRTERGMPCIWYVSVLHYQDNAMYQAKTNPNHIWQYVFRAHTSEQNSYLLCWARLVSASMTGVTRHYSMCHSTRSAWVYSHGDGSFPRKQVPTCKPISSLCFKGCLEVKVKSKEGQLMVGEDCSYMAKGVKTKGITKGMVRIEAIPHYNYL